MSKPLAKIMNRSIETRIFPGKLKQAKITPIYKTGDELECGNYRPISLLSNINRIFEKLMFNRVKAFITKHDILCSSQYGFRQNHSTEHALLDIVSKIQTSMDKNLFSCGILIDLQKAFDTVDHEISLIYIIEIIMVLEQTLGAHHKLLSLSLRILYRFGLSDTFP